MLVLLYGADNYRSKKKLNEVVGRYKKIHQSGLNYLQFSEENFSLEKFQTAIESVSMFNEKKLFVFLNLFNKVLVPLTEQFQNYFERWNLKQSKDIIIVIYESDVLDEKNPLFKYLVKPPIFCQKFQPLSGFRLHQWIKKEFSKNDFQVDDSVISLLSSYLGNDLWALNNAIEKLILYQLSAGRKQILLESVKSLIESKIEADIFQMVEALGERNKEKAFNLLHKHLSLGENELYLLSMFIWQFRNLMQVKDLVEKNVPFSHLSKILKMHPFVIKKTYYQAKLFHLNELKKIYQRLLKIDQDVKTGQIESSLALDVFIAEM